MKYKDVKISTMLGKLNSYLKEKDITDIAESEYPDLVEYEINQFLSQNGYPFQCKHEDYGYALYVIPEHIVAVDLKERHTTNKGPIGKRKRSFRRIIKTGPGFQLNVSEMIERRRKGIYFHVDDTMYEIKKLGYKDPDEMLAAYEEAKKVVASTSRARYLFDGLDETEKDLVKKELEKKNEV